MASATLMLRTVSRCSFRTASRFNSLTSSGCVRFSSHFTPAHEYARVDGGVATCGITDFAQALLGDIVYIDLPEVGDEVEKGDPIGSVESVKAASDVYAPVSGTVTEINELLSDEPAIVNSSPEKKGYFVKIEMTDDSEVEDLMTPEAYKEHCEKESDAH